MVGVYDKAVCDEVVQPACTFTCIRERLLNLQMLGRPLSIFERDFDTPYPAEDPVSLLRMWRHG